MYTCRPVWCIGCGWYQAVIGRCVTSYSVTQVAPGATITYGPPSLAAGTCMPCQCKVDGSASELVISRRTRSPRRNRSVGPR